MRRIGNRILTLPEGVTANVDGNKLTVKGPKGELSLTVDSLVKVVVNEGTIATEQVKKTKTANIMQGTTNSLINNMIIGVSKGRNPNSS